MPFRILCAAFVSLGLGTLALAAEGKSSSSSSSHTLGGPRAGLSIGTWKGTFSETYKSQTGKFDIKPAWGGTLFLGLNLGSFFFDYSPTWFALPKLKGSDSGPTNSSHFSWLGFDVGVSARQYFPFLPVEAYVGWENGGLTFQEGTEDSFGGSAYKVGVDVPIKTGADTYVGVKWEYRVHSLNSDSDGHLPEGVSQSFKSFFIGVLIMFE